MTQIQHAPVGGWAASQPVARLRRATDRRGVICPTSPSVITTQSAKSAQSADYHPAMRTRHLVAWTITLVAFGSPARARVPAPPGAGAECAALTALELPEVTVTEAVAVSTPAGPIKVPHCRVSGVIERDIRFTLLLPETWNGKFMMGGGGGFVGTIDNQALATVNRGFATVGTDTGHQGGASTAKWALDDLERQINFGYLAVHRVAVVSKAIVRRHYGSRETHAYFSGCSNGGRQALMEAQRYPDDFDGIIAGAPAADFTGIGAQFIKDIQAAFPDPARVSTPLFSNDLLKSVEAQIVARCDAIDGAKDGLMNDPRECRVDLATLTGLSDAQRRTLGAIYAETKAGSDVIHPAQPFGGEGEPAGWPGWIVGANPLLLASQQVPSLRFAFGTELFKYFVFGNPSWDYSRYDLSSFRRDAAQASAFLNATNPNLDAFKASGGKLIIWHGWSDPALTALGSIRYYEQVRERDPNTSDYARLFMMPGVLHCIGGPGPDNVDWVSAMMNWVEKGQAPQRIIARKTAGAATRTRPLCPHPQRAVYDGTGSLDDEKSFVCK
jgi:feruloyl esterase